METQEFERELKNTNRKIKFLEKKVITLKEDLKK